MRDAESILDQLLSAGGDDLTADAVRDLLGLADAETVASFSGALVAGDPAAGIAVLDALEDRGRDLGSFAGQVVDALRAALHLALAGRSAADPLAARGVTPLAAAARRLSAIDSSRPGPGGLRLAMELALFDAAAAGAPPAAASVPADGAPPVAATTVRAGTVPALPTAVSVPAATVPALAPATGAPRSAPGGVPISGQAAATPVGVAAAPSSELPAPRVEPTPPDAESAPTPAAKRRGAPRSASQSVAPTPPAAPSPAPAGASDPATSGPEPVADATPGVALDELRRRWPEVVALISRHPPTKPLIEACRPIAVEGAVVTLGFPESQLFLRDVADRRRATLEDGLGRVLGRPVSVRCVATNVDPEPAAPADAEGAAVLRAARDVWGDDLVEAPEVR